MATLYVNSATGDDSRSYATAQNSGTPWATIARAAWGSTSYGSPNASAAAQAGDTVLVAAGTYTESGNTSGSRFTVALNPANSGTSGNPITFRGVGTVTLRLGTTIRGPVIGASGRDYIVWDNFVIDDTYAGSVSDTGPVVFHDCTGCQLLNSEIAGHNGSYDNGTSTFTGNYNLVRLEFGDNVLVKNNHFSRVWGTGSTVGSGGQNDAAIMTYSSTNSTFEHNEFVDCGMPIMLKGIIAPDTTEAPQHHFTIRYNYIHDNPRGIFVWLAQDALVYQNIIADTDVPIGFGYDGSSIPTAATRARIINNTIYNSTEGAIWPSGTKMREPWVKNNIVHTVPHAYYNLLEASPSAQTGSPQLMEIDRNLHYGVTSNFARYNADGSALNITFATWQGTYGLDTNGSNGTDPEFVNGSPTTAAHFKLANNGQTARTMGRVVESIGGTNGATIPVGAYITGNETIGVATGDTTPPSAPTGVRVA